MAGAGLVTVRVAAVELPPPGVPLLTTRLRMAAAARSALLRVVVSCVALTKVTGWLAPLTVSVVEETKFVPWTVRVAVGVPRRMEEGEIDVTVGTGLSTVRVCGAAAEEAPGPLLTVIDRAEPVARKEPGRVAWSTLLLTKVVEMAVLLTCTTEDGWNPEPFTVIGVAAVDPATSVAGEMELMAGAAGEGVEGAAPQPQSQSANAARAR